MSSRSGRADNDPLTNAHLLSRSEPATGAPAGSAVVNGLPQLRTRPVYVDHSLSAQWRGTSGRVVHQSAYVNDRQRYGLFVILFLIAALLIVGTLHFSEPRDSHPAAVLPPDHPHMLKRAAAMAQAQASAAMAAAGTVSAGANPLSSPYSVLYVTVPSADVAQKLAAGLLDSKLIACANIVPGVTSMYRWEGKVQTDTEQLMMLKTRASLFQRVKQFVTENHPYQTPEIIELPIQQGHQPYLDWIRDNTQDPTQS